MYQYTNINEKTGTALRVLATHDGPIRKRLHKAYIEICDIRDFPLGLDWSQELKELRAIMTSGSPMPEGSVASSANSLSDEDARDIANRTFTVCLEIRDWFKEGGNK